MSSALRSESLLDLSQPRVIQMHDRGRAFTVTCRRVTRADWYGYYAAIVMTSEQIGNRRVDVNDVDTALVSLAEYVATDATGYIVQGGAKLTELPGWQNRLPLAHRRQVGATLCDVRVSDAAGDFTILPEGEEVFLDATWSCFGSGMQHFTGLRHQFKTPSAAQHKRFTEAASRSVVVGGSRSGKTVFPGSQTVLAELYDELIVAAEGYIAGDAPLTSRAVIVEQMDTHHKVSAAKELFRPTATVNVGEEEEGE